MTTPDRTEDLLRLMLERRAGAPPPGWLLPGVAEAVRQSGQVRGGHAWSSVLSTRRFGRMGLVAAAALVLLALAAGVLVAARLILPPPQPTLPAIVVLPSPSATLPPATPEPRTEPANEPQAVPTPAPPALAPDTIAVVTNAGDGLRVRSRPSVGADSEKFSPLLKKGARMLIVDGPVAADTYDWYEVLADNDLFGWVAAGKGGEDWIEPTEPKCTDDLDELAVRTIDPIDFLVCYGDTPVSAHVQWSSLEEGIDIEDPSKCPYTGDNVQCSARPNWLLEPHEFTFVTTGASPNFLAAAHGSVLADMRRVPEPSTMTLTIAMDAPQAQDCRVVDENGRDLISRDEAITRCRLTFAVRDMAWDAESYRFEHDSLAVVVPSHVIGYATPNGAQLEPRFSAGDEVLVVDGPVAAGGTNWYAVVAYHGTSPGFGWVALTTASGDWPLAPVIPDCPRDQDWRSMAEVLPGVLLACFGSEEITADLTVTRQQPPEPTWGGCDLYRSRGAIPTQPCQASPEWLATFSGISATDRKGRGMGVELRFDPSRIDRESFPTTPTLMRVTGSFANDASGECQLLNPETHQPLVDDLEASAYCRSQFVVTKLEPAP